jgi:hypothetical protein
MGEFARCATAGTFVALAGIYVGAQAPRPAAPARDAAPILAAARQALGGDKKLTAVKTFTATGRTKQVRGENLVPIEFEIFVELPDKYVRKDEVPAQETGVTAAGFNGDDLLQDPPPPPPPPLPTPPAGAPAGAPAGPPRNPSAARVNQLKQDFARLTLGMFAASFSSYPLTYTYVGQAEAPQGKADVVEAKGAGNFTVRFFVNTQTHLPVMVSWSPPGRPQATTVMPPPQAGAAAPPAAAPKPPEFRIYYADYRDADGLMWPYRLRRATNTDTTEETTFDRFRTNVKIDPKKFEVVK